MSLTALAATAVALLAGVASAASSPSVVINGATTYQTMAGFGASEAFGVAKSIEAATPAVRNALLADLFSPVTGAGLTIIRNEVVGDASGSIEPTAPSSPTATPTYVSLASTGDDEGQLSFDLQAKQQYGVSNDFADAWSAPGFMKTNDSVDNGGTLCGVPSATCTSGDWRQAYANYLTQYARDYANAGVPLSYIGFENEAAGAATYDSMLMNPAQTANFMDTLGPTLASSGLSTKGECCASIGWTTAASYFSALTSDPVAAKYTALYTSHGYAAPPNSVLDTDGKPVWQTEWANFAAWDPAWDDGTTAAGFTWAQRIYTGLTSANLSAFLYWWGAVPETTSTSNSALIQFNGSTISIPSRLWAFANYSRYIRPGAVRLGATTTDGNLEVTAFRNTDGSDSVVVINTGTTADTASVSLQNLNNSSTFTVPYLTDATSSTAAQAPVAIANGAFTDSVPARSLTTFVIPDPSSAARQSHPSGPSGQPHPTGQRQPSREPHPTGPCRV